MPYPPPPGPPGVGEFQAIGLLQAPAIPDVTGNAGKFLETDGVVPQWEPVTGVLPDQTGQAGNFLTTNGTSASWAAIPAGSTFDLRDYGAVADDPTNDVSVAFYNAVAAFNQMLVGLTEIFGTNGPFGAIVFPQGTFYTSRPLCVPANCEIYGAGKTLTMVVPGTGDHTTPSLVQGYAGPIFFASPAWTPGMLPNVSQPSLGTSLATGSGNCLNLAPGTDVLHVTASYPLHDSFPWGTWMGNDYTLTAWSLELFVRVDNHPGTAAEEGTLGIIGSYGPGVWGSRDQNFPYDSAFSLRAVVDGSNITLEARITTNPAYTGPFNTVASGTTVLLSGTVARATVRHVELDYTGSNFYFYINGVLQGSTAATGPIIRAPWEQTQIGATGSEWSHSDNTVTGAVDGIRMSKVARHTGSNFTPPTSKPTWDSNTMALYNFDQSAPTIQPRDSGGGDVGPLLTLPMFIPGVLRSGINESTWFSPALGDQVPHYVDLWPIGFAQSIYIHDLAVTGWWSCVGIKGKRSPRLWVYRTVINEMANAGIWAADAESFFGQLSDNYLGNVAGSAIVQFGRADRNEALQCGIGIYNTAAGAVTWFNNQPTYSSYACIVGAGGSQFSQYNIQNVSNDTEGWAFTRMIGAGVLIGQAASWFSSGNQWAAGGTSSPLKIFGNATLTNLPEEAGAFASIGDVFLPPVTGAKSIIDFDSASTPIVSITLQNAYIADFNEPRLPLSNVEGLVAIHDSAGFSNLRGLSISDVKAANLAGSFTCQDAFTWGQVVFTNPEPDANYQVVVTLQATDGSPAANSRIVDHIDYFADRFVVSFVAAPGMGVTNTWAWQLVRVEPPALYYDAHPSLPSSFSNPFGGEVNRPFAIAMTLTPSTGNTFYFGNFTQQTILSAGATIGAADSWEVNWEATLFFASEYCGTSHLELDPFVQNGKLCTHRNPGSHNVGFYFDGSTYYYLIDGQAKLILPGSNPFGTQPATVYVGERSDTTNPLTIASIANLKMDRTPARVYSFEQTIGPGLQLQAALFGDDWVTGQGASASSPWSAQVINNKYGTTYYWMPNKQAQLTGPFGLGTTLWQPWAGTSSSLSLSAVVIMCGWYDCLNSVPAATTFAGLQAIVEGGPASATWNPPTSGTTPTDQRSFAIVQVNSSGTSVLTIDGHNINMVWQGSFAATTAFVVNAINTTPATDAIVTATAQAADPTQKTLIINTNVIGTAGNGMVISTDGVGGSGVYGDLGTGPGFALSAKTFDGTDNTVTISGQTFVCNFDTDVTTTINNLVTAITGSSLNATLAAANAGTTMSLTARTNGTAGNTVRLSGTGFNTSGAVPAWSNPVTANAVHMDGGFNGAISLGATTILVCNVPPFGTNSSYSAGKDAIRVTLNGLIGGYAAAGVTIVDLDLLVRDAGAHQNINPAYDAGNGYPNDACQTAIYGLIQPLLP